MFGPSIIRKPRGFYDHAVFGAGGLTHTGDTNETTLATVAIPGGAMGANGILRIHSLWSHPGGSGNSKTTRARLGGIAGTAFLAGVQTTNLSTTSFILIRNRNNAASQVSQPAGLASGVGGTASAVTTGTVNTAVAQDLVFTAQLASGAESITLEAYLVEILYRA